MSAPIAFKPCSEQCIVTQSYHAPQCEHHPTRANPNGTGFSPFMVHTLTRLQYLEEQLAAKEAPAENV